MLIVDHDALTYEFLETFMLNINVSRSEEVFCFGEYKRTFFWCVMLKK